MQATDIMIHVSDDLNSQQQGRIESQLRDIDGVIAPRFNKAHLLLIYFNLDKTSSSVLLNQVQSAGCRAQLVGI